MATPIVIQGQPFNYPDAGDPPGWGADASDAFIALVNQVEGLSPATDILTSSADLSYGVVVPTPTGSLTFDSSLVQGAVVEYNVVNTSIPASETGSMLLVYSGGHWYMTQQATAIDAGVYFSINDSGQILYTSASGAGSLTITFRARTL